MNHMEATWAQGKTIFTYAVPEDRAIDKDPADMTLEELVATQDRELPTISKTSWRLTGKGTLSTNRPSQTEEGDGSTIADRLPDDNEVKAGWKTATPRSEMTVEQLREFDRWCAENTRGTRMTPYKTVHPLTSWRIQNEKDSARSTAPVSYSLVNQHGTTVVSIRGKKLSAPEFEKEAKRYLRILRDVHGHVPTLDDIEASHAETKELYEAIRAGNVGFRKFDYQVTYLMSDETDPYRDDFFDEIAHSSYETFEEPWVDDTFVTSMGLDPDQVMDEMPRTLIRHFRSKRDKLRHLVNPSHSDAFWHARLGQPLEIGEDRGYQTKGRRPSSNDLASQIRDIDDPTVTALSTLTD